MDQHKFYKQMFSEWHGAQLASKLNTNTHTYQSESIKELFAVLDIFLTLPIRTCIEMEHPMLLTTSCRISLSSAPLTQDYHIDVNHLSCTDHYTITPDTSKSWLTTYHISYTHPSWYCFDFHYLLVDHLPNTDIKPREFVTQDHQLINERTVTKDQLNHYGEWIIHGSWIIEHLLNQLESLSQDQPRSSLKITFIKPWLQSHILTTYHDSNSDKLQLIAENDDIHPHVIASCSYLLTH